jgi:hypothetical protein
MNRKRAQILDPITPIFLEVSAGHSEYKVDNVFDGAFSANNAKVEREIEENIKCDSKLVEMTDAETLDFSQFVNEEMADTGIFDFSQVVNDDLRPTYFRRSLPYLFDIYPSKIPSPINSYQATTPSLLSSNTANDFERSLQIATPRLSTGKETETKDSQNIPRD